ncbi:MAG: DNA topoisomerase [Eubacteriales bacterium]|nr:DNA topoisomerase [Eubacteriales bacterium]
MILIIAEKPSLARNIVAGIGTMQKKNGYFEGQGYLVTWAFGHLFTLYDINDYLGVPSDARWKIDELPCFPKEFRFKLKPGADKKPDAGVERQFGIIKALCNRADVDTIVNAGDSDREGEIIVRLCVMNTGASGKSFKRLWLPDQTPETVSKALQEMKDETDYECLANEGFARTYIDWLYGVNLTRYATLRTGTLLRVGRVIVPIVKAIYDRDMTIKNFVPDIYYAVASKEQTKGFDVELISREKFGNDEKEKARAQALCDKYNASDAIVISKKTKKETVNPGKLYSLSKLQNVLGKKYKMSMADSLAIVQKLYEEGYLTYPRTNSEYLATNEKDKIKKIISNISDIGYPVVFKDKKTIFDDSKIESHSAITPTYKIPKKGALTENEFTVYQTVFRRFVSVFCSEDCLAQKTEIVIDVGGYEQFTIKGTIILQKGFLRFDDSERKDKLLPPLEKGDKVNICFKPMEKQTSPPKHYTIETLNNYLKNPFREDKAKLAEGGDAEQSDAGTDDTEDYRAIFEGLELGTEATRTGIIDNARRSLYIDLKKDVYTILPGGIYMIESLEQMQISMDKYKTSELGKALKKVFHGKMTVEESVGLAEKEIDEIFRSVSEPPERDRDTGFYGDIVGKCPVCGKNVIRGRYGYGCTGYKEGCKFRFGAYICKRAISLSNAKLLLSEGQTSVIEGFTSKNGKLFNGRLKLTDGENGEKKVVFDFS